MNAIALYSGSTVLYWSALVIALGAAAWLLLSRALYVTDGGEGYVLWIWFPIAALLSVLFARFLHWYCHTEQYPGFFAAMTRYSSGGYCLPGLLLGAWLAAVLMKRFRFVASSARLLDALAPGAALSIALIRLSALFTNSCRGKLVITKPLFQRLPFGSGLRTVSGVTEYRFATFFVEFLLLLILTALLVRFFLCRRRRPMKFGPREGHVARMFLLGFSAIEAVLDSTRYDSSFLRSNGFVSLSQIVSGFCLLALLVYYSRRSVRANGRRVYHGLLWLGWLLGLAATGYLEYLVQRHGDWYLFCYSMMTLSVALMALSVYAMYRTLCRPPRRGRKAPAANPAR